jgi:hypothetical protein
MRRWTWLGIVVAICFLVSAATFATTALGLAGPAEPALAGDVDAYLTAYLRYRRDLYPFEQVENWSLAVALVGFGLLGGLLTTTRALTDRMVGYVIGALLVSGSLIAAATQILYLGALERVLTASTSPPFDTATPGTLTAVIDRTDDYLENFGLLLIAAGLAGLVRLGTRPWSVLTGLLALSSLGLVFASFAESDLTDPLLLIVGVVLAPAWSVWLGRRLGAPSAGSGR